MDACSIILFDVIVLIIMLWRKIPLWIVFLVVGTMTAYVYNGLQGVLETYQRVSMDRSTWDLVFIMFLISVFVSLYRSSGFIDKLSRELTNLFRRPRLVLMFVPAILGLLPVPGGALMSAPVVDRVGDHLGLNRVRKLFVNVWFRHVIFIVYPLSTVLIMTAVLTNTDLWAIILRQAPIALAMIFIGYLIGFPLHSRGEYVVGGSVDREMLLKTFTPIIITIALALTTAPFLDYKYPLPFNRVSMIIAVTTGIALLLHFSRKPLKILFKTIKSREVVELTLIGYGAMLMRGVFTSMDLTCIASYISLENPLVLVVGIPIFFSLVAGVISSSIALSIPLIMGIIPVDVKTASLIYLSAFIGYLGSPLHLCYVYSAEYLKTSIIKGYKYLLPAVVITLVLAIVYYMLI